MIASGSPYSAAMSSGSGANAREPMIPVAVAEIDRSLEEADRLLAVLGDRLSPILRPGVPAGDQLAKAGPREMQPPLAEHLQELSAKVRRLSASIQHLTDRVEL